MSKSSPWKGIQRYYQRKVFSIVVSKGISFSRKRWCCATSAKLDTCSTRISLWLHPPHKILACLSLSRVVFLHRIKILYPLILLQRFTLAVNTHKTLLHCQRKWTGKFILGKMLTWIQALNWIQTPALILTHEVNLALGRRFLLEESPFQPSE